MQCLKTALFHAVCNDHKEVVELLLEAGAATATDQARGRRIDTEAGICTLPSFIPSLSSTYSGVHS